MNRQIALIYLSILGGLILPKHSLSQDKIIYSIYKMERKIGTEEVLSTQANGQVTDQINIVTNDRGADMALNCLFTSNSEKTSYRSVGHTSRFKKEHADTTFITGTNFPISDNGSIWMKSQLLSFWLKNGKPKTIKSAWNGELSTITKIAEETDPLTQQTLSVIELKNQHNEILWINAEGHAVYLASCDTEGDKREIIDNKYLSFFNNFNIKSNEYLIETYRKANKSLAVSYENIVLTGGNVIDLADGGKILYDNMLLIKNGKIEYIGKTDRQLIPEGAHVIDVTNKFLIPGLWNMHVHIFHPDYLKKELLTGVTSVRDMANEFDFVSRLKKSIAEPHFPAPRLMTAGVIDGNSKFSLGIVIATDDKTAKQEVKRYYDTGFDQIKVYSYVKKNVLTAIVTEANRYHMDVVGHLPVGYLLGTVVDNGIKSISHIHYFMNSLKWGKDNLITDNKVLLDHIKEKNIYLDPTLNVYSLTGDPKIGNYKRILKQLHAYGIPVVAGTDNEGSLIQELESYVSLGFSPLEALQSATIIPAKMMNMTHQSGSLHQGKNSDILVLNANPLENISALQQLNIIIKGQSIIMKEKEQ
ncbi:amidohydrolase family protein [Pedobacter gandavensis]|uniref:Amidohydrolase family protein n=1 Tax=Pedobacter gandavensis TaxID=2679963 RepID=A0ABR6ETR1_9SPHI|nr:amidohydrolase family protein [Pedobacter gandavensis]MBB2148586.1 amidohydrolase family protein [Pedobacter gandavensis]